MVKIVRRLFYLVVSEMSFPFPSDANLHDVCQLHRAFLLSQSLLPGFLLSFEMTGSQCNGFIFLIQLQTVSLMIELVLLNVVGQ